MSEMKQADSSNEPTNRYLKDQAYDRLKTSVQIIIPAVSSLYFVLGAVFGLPAVEQVVGVLALLAIFVGIVLRISSKRYDASEARFDGDIVVTQNEQGGVLYSLELKGDPKDIDLMNSVNFKVKKPS